MLSHALYSESRHNDHKVCHGDQKNWSFSILTRVFAVFTPFWIKTIDLKAEKIK